MISGGSEPVLRLGLFAAVFVAFAVLEVLFAERPMLILPVIVGFGVTRILTLFN